MSPVLSQDEIDALTGQSGGSVDATAVVAYNFRRHDRVSKDQIRSLHFLHERFARNATTSLAAFLRTSVELSVVSVEQFDYSDFLMSLPDPTAFYAISLAPLDTMGALELNPGVAFAMVDRILGGSGDTPTPQRALTEIEQNVVDSVVRLLFDHLTETWHPVIDVRFQIHARETRPQMLQVASWKEAVILLAFDLKVGEMRGLLNICVPATLVETSGAGLVQGWQQSRRDPTGEERGWVLENLGRVRLPVTSDLRARVTTRELLQIAPGEVLNLGIPAETEVDVCVGDILKFKGRLAEQGGRAAVLVNRACATRGGPGVEAKP